MASGKHWNDLLSRNSIDCILPAEDDSTSVPRINIAGIGHCNSSSHIPISVDTYEFSATQRRNDQDYEMDQCTAPVVYVYLLKVEETWRLNDHAAFLSNYEVLKLLSDLKNDRSDPPSFLQRLSKRKKHTFDEKGLQNLNTIVYETMEYLEQTPCATQSPDAIQAFLLAIKPYSLTKPEKLQLINLRPTTLVEIQLLIEDGEERLTEEQMQEILDIVAEKLPPGPSSEEGENMEGIEN